MRVSAFVLMSLTALPFASRAFVSEISEIANSISEVNSMVEEATGIDIQGVMDADITSVAGEVGLDSYAGDIAAVSSTAVNLAGSVEVVPQTPDPWTVVDELQYAVETDLADIGETLKCMEYNFIGVCFSWRMTWKGPRFYTNSIVEHYVRDTHIEVRDGLARNGMDDKTVTDFFAGGIISDVLPVLDVLDIPLSGEGVFNPSLIKRVGADQPTRYRDGHRYLTREVLVMGNGIDGQMHQSVLGGVIGLFGWCNSPNMPMIPYYSSLLDSFSWRYMPTVETLLYAPYSLKNFSTADIGDDFAHTFPRQNRVYTASKYKAAAVAATRGLHIAASNEAIFSGMAGLHVHVPMGQYSPGSWTRSFYKTKQNTKSFKFEMFYPYKGERCTDFKESKNFLLDERELKFNSGNSYGSAGYKAYRPFRCCRKRGRHIADITVIPPML
ncbi:TraU family protein [Vibrio owensii]|uniref:TraU family protein n=1 Tax=Vibrio owensii TaxID=696485 RepID=UPI0018F11AFC|nr:TraU family protein [Vibrio owensii]